MDLQDVYRDLSKKLFMENSSVMPRIWALVCPPREAEIVNALPATSVKLSEKFCMEEEEMLAILKELFHRGAVFEAAKDGTTVYRMPRHVVQFHDSTILWEEAPAELMNLWIEFGETDYPALLELVTQVKLPSFMRVIPIGESISARNQVLAHEDALKMLESARSIAVTTCVCRKLMKLCDGPLEVCLQLNKGAEYCIKRGTGRQIDFEEAVKILKQSREAGLVHMTENTPGRANIICNCCSCCCEMLRFSRDTKTKGVVSPSRYQAVITADACTGCGVCTDICPVRVISLTPQGPVQIEKENCIGCGLCTTVCPTGAISLIEVRPPEFIPS